MVKKKGEKEEEEEKEKNLLFFFNWNIIALPYCVSFCHTTT